MGQETSLEEDKRTPEEWMTIIKVSEKLIELDEVQDEADSLPDGPVPRFSTNFEIPPNVRDWIKDIEKESVDFAYV